MVLIRTHIIKDINEAFTKEQLYPIIGMIESDRKRFELDVPHFPSESEVRRIAEKYEINPDHFYFVEKSLPCYCYYDFPAYLTIDVFNDQFFEFLRVSERIKAVVKESHEALHNKDYYKIFAFSEDQAKVLLLNKMYWLVLDEEKYELYNQIYTRLDYGHTLIDLKIQRDVWRHQPKEEKERLKKMLDKSYKEAYLTIFRGEGSGSTPHNQSMSWTTSLNVACFFATRIRSDIQSKVYQAKILKAHVLDYNTHRIEEEIIVFPEQLENVVQIPMVDLFEEWKDLQEEGYIDEYFLYKNTFIKSSHYRNPDGIHGIPHVKHVLFHAITLSRALGLNSRDRAILANASIYHDIGRGHDGHCTMHGDWSWKQYVEDIVTKEDLFQGEINYVENVKQGIFDAHHKPLNDYEMKIVEFLIRYHCRDDDESLETLENMFIDQKEREHAWMLYQVFKDCDGLDRVRLPLNELDVKYFRTEEAKNRLIFAYQVQNKTSEL